MIQQLYFDLYDYLKGYFNMEFRNDKKSNGEIYSTLNVYPIHSPVVCMSFMDDCDARFLKVWLGSGHHNLGRVHHMWRSRDEDDDVPRVIKVFMYNKSVVTIRMHEGKAKITLNAKEEFSCQ